MNLNNSKSNLLITMSGGTTTVINATLAGIIKGVRATGHFNKIYGGYPGITGVFEESFLDLTSLTDNELKLLRCTPGSATIGTSRIEIIDDQAMDTLKKVFDSWQIKAFINIGGNGTIKQTKSIAKILGENVKVAAAPKTVDNDLGDIKCRNVFFTPGFPSCVNHWIRLTSLLNLENLGACSHDQVLVAQTFGRETGFLAGAARVADIERKLPLIILLPEDQQPTNKVIDFIKETVSEFGRAIVILAEGYEVGDIGNVYDATGQIMYGSSKTTTAQLLVDYLLEANIQSRSFIPTVLQRQAFYDTLEFDLDIAERLGAFIVDQFVEGNSEFLVSCKNPDYSNGDYRDPIDTIPFNSFGEYSRRLDSTFIKKGLYDVSDSYISYLNSLFNVSRFESSYAKYSNSFFMPNNLKQASNKK